MPQETFGFFLEGFKQWPLIIVLTEKQIVIKKTLTDEFWVKDTSMLTPVEKVYYEILFDFGSKAHAVTYSTGAAYDSVKKLYPQIASTKYSKYLHSKLVNNHLHFKKAIPAACHGHQQQRLLATAILCAHHRAIHRWFWLLFRGKHKQKIQLRWCRQH